MLPGHRAARATRPSRPRDGLRRVIALVLPEAALPPSPLHAVLSPTGEVVGPLPELPAGALQRMHHTMRLVRLLDQRMLNLQRQGRVGFYGTCTGQEAVPVGVAEAALDDEWIFPALREGAAMLHRGYPLEPYLAQVFGVGLDPSRGRQMPSHQASADVRYVSWSSCIGNQLPQAVGAARAVESGRAVIAFMGDGATSTGDFHVALQAAARDRLPCVFFCQNNHWSISIPVHRQTASPSLASRASAYGMPSARVDGNDVLAVYGAAREALLRARGGQGPAFIELVTYRMGAHSSSDDPNVYRDPAEVERWRALDPLDRLERYIGAQGEGAPDRFEVLARELRARIDAAIAVAEAEPAASSSEMTHDVYA